MHLQTLLLVAPHHFVHENPKPFSNEFFEPIQRRTMALCHCEMINSSVVLILCKTWWKSEKKSIAPTRISHAGRISKQPLDRQGASQTLKLLRMLQQPSPCS